MAPGEKRWPTGARVLTALSIAAVVGVNAAGLWGIAVARGGAQEEVERLFRLETASEAATVESRLLATRADLAFLAGSSAASRPESLGRPAGRWEEEWRRLASEAILVFMRGHPEVARLAVRSGSGHTLVRTGRRGGVPVLWTSDEQQASAAGAPRGHVEAVFEFGQKPPDVVRLLAEVDPAVLLARGTEAAPESRRCSLVDAQGGVLAAEPLASGPPGPAGALSAEAPIRAEGWSHPSPWALRCTGSRAGAAALLDPVAQRYRVTLGLNLGVMALAVLLGSFAIQQARSRERLLAQAREEQRVRELERQLFHADRLSTVGRLAAGLAHEINNPLEGMSNYLTLAREDLARGDTAAAARRLDGVREGVERVAGTVRQVLAQAEPGGAPRSPVDVGALLRQTLEFVRTRGEFRNIAFAQNGQGEGLTVRGNGVMLGQVLLNIVINACEAQPQGGEVGVGARREHDQVVIDIADRGPGIPEPDRTRIFEAFYSTKESTGLGLSICHTIVREHDGALSVLDRPGGGSVFRVSLPAA
jgi:signal transduction histidine kinase